MLLNELVRIAQTSEDTTIAPLGYKIFGKASPIRWILHLDPQTGQLLGEPEGTEIDHKPRPVRQRSGKASESNIKPYLLVDEARYVLGLAEPGREKEAQWQHQSFLDLLQRAAQATALPELEIMVQFLRTNMDRQALGQKIKPKDVVTLQVGPPPYAFERPEVQAFWQHYVEEEFSSKVPGVCGVCGASANLIQTLPLEMIIMGQKCQITSFNKSAFLSFGKEQTLNASLCSRCGLLAPQGLEYLLKNKQHRTVLLRDDSKGAGGTSLQNQLAVYWLRQAQKVLIEEQEYDLLALLTAPLPSTLEPVEVQPTLALLEKFVQMPWSGSDSPLNLPDNAFFLTVLSANKGRLVVREWIEASVPQLRQRLRQFLSALRLIGPRAEPAAVYPLPLLLGPLQSTDPNLLRGLLRSAYLGAPPPAGLLATAVNRLRTPEGRTLEAVNKQPAPFWVLAAVIKFALFFGKKEADTMVELHPQHHQPPYLCGRLLAVLEEAQRRAATGKLNTTVVDRFYGAASTSPAAALSPLLKLALTAHLPKIRRENRGYTRLNELLGEILNALDGVGGFPRTLSLVDQARFALGFYHQRAALAAPSQNTATTV
ncbi:MAG: type I-C CRISPR-associated protein Cas8c/Csd1 [Desulfobacca sp.]|uniref:type I-C CRISPR-associated protein Cas8c/Csd1 n=1 Tax=Desulfobacca sp. TaxID=2067990 RepID=UPI00404B7AB6